MNDNPFAPPRDDAANPANPANTASSTPNLNDTAPLPPALGDTAPMPRMDDAQDSNASEPAEAPVTEQLAAPSAPEPAIAPTQPMPAAAPTQPMPAAAPTQPLATAAPSAPSAPERPSTFATFAAPGEHAAPVNPCAPPAAGQQYAQPHYAATPQQYAQQQASPHHPGPQQGPFQAPQHAEASPSAPRERSTRGKVSGGAVAGIVVGALVVGAAAGLGGAYAYDTWIDDSSNAASATLPAAGSSSIVSTHATTVSAIASEVMPSVVSIENVQGGQLASEGSGFIISEDGYLLTNNHVVSGSDDDTVNVVMSDGSEYSGEVIGATADYDLAVVKIDADGLTPLVLGDSDQVVVGEDVIAVGSPLGLQSTVTTGIVSSLHRPVTAGDTSSTAFIDAIQTDAAINPGNSGGPLINADGEVIGINSAIASLGSTSEQAGSVGLGFAIPSNQARRTAEEIIATGTATYPVVGVVLDGSYTGEGVRVAEQDGSVAAGGPAAEAGIRAGDVITAIDGRPITRSDELIVAIRAKASDDTVTLTVRRGDNESDIAVTLVPNTDVSYGDSGEDQQEQEQQPESGGGFGDLFPDQSE